MREILATPIGAVTLTLAVYRAAGQVNARLKWALVNPILVTIGSLICLLTLLDVDFETYDEGDG